MDANEISHHNKYAYVDYNDDDHDSDLESRLYSEIYFSNSIIGEDANSKSSSLQINKESVSSNPTNNDSDNKNANENSQNNKNNGDNHVINNSSEPNSLLSGNVSKNTNNTVKQIPVVSQNNEDNIEKNKKLNSKKRSTTNENHSESGDSTAKKNKFDLKNTIVNPYNKHVVNNPQQCMKLLSPEFLNIFFGKQKNRKKTEKSDKTQSKQNKNKISRKSKDSELVQSENLSSNFQSNRTADKEIEEIERNEVSEDGNQRNNITNVSDIIDISSESSRESIEDNSKYSTSVATEKKLSKRDIMNNAESDSSSDSEESIFEVPVPPKPAPPVIELKESDNEITDESDDDSYSNNLSSCDSEDDSEFEKSIDIALNTTHDLSDSSESENDESEESDNLILNCTGVQRGVATIDEIKKMSHETSSSKETLKKTSLNVTSSYTDNANYGKNVQDQSNETSVTELQNASIIQKNKSTSQSTSTKKTNSDENYFLRPMSDQMKSFYNDSWGGENFDMDMLRGKMSRDPKKWAILDTDIVSLSSKSKRYFGVVCARCQKSGHKHTQCPLQYNNPVCQMCGATGHFVHACPNKKCLTCGSRQPAFKKTCERCQKMYCTRCQSQGHTENTCPDLWRRYHHTISSTAPVIPRNPKDVMKSRYDLYCCNCAKKGHDTLVCRKLRWSQHFTNPPYVINYIGPCYQEDFDTYSNVNDTRESSFSLNSTSSFNNTLNDTIDLNTSNDKLPIHRQNSRNDLISNSIQPNQKFIFKRKSKLMDESIKLGKLSLRYDLPKPKSYCDYDDWRSLIIFFDNFLLSSAGEFCLEQNDRKLFIDILCGRKFHTVLKQIVNQYTSCNNLERSYLFLNWERDGKKIVKHLECKMVELENLKEDPLQLYQELCQLLDELKNQANENHQNSLKCNKLALCQQKLLMALYKEGSCDSSLKELLKLKKKFNTVRASRAVKKKQKFTGNKSLVSIKALIQYLYFYNNVFASYKPTKLSHFIKTYKDHLQRCDRLRANPLLFPVNQNVTVQNNSINLESSAPVTHTTPVQSISTTISQTSPLQVKDPLTSFQPPPLLSVNTSIVNNFHFSQELPSNVNSTSQANNKYFSPIKSNIKTPQKASKKVFPERTLEYIMTKRPLNSSYQMALEADGIKKKKLLKSFNKFLSNAKTLVEDARKLNKPNLQKDINMLAEKLKYEKHLYKKDVKPLAKLVEKEQSKMKELYNKGKVVK